MTEASGPEIVGDAPGAVATAGGQTLDVVVAGVAAAAASALRAP